MKGNTRIVQAPEIPHTFDLGLSGAAAVVLDVFHERHLESDWVSHHLTLK